MFVCDKTEIKRKLHCETTHAYVAKKTQIINSENTDADEITFASKKVKTNYTDLITKTC